MDDFNSSLIKLKKQQENERKKFIEKKQRDKKIQQNIPFNLKLNDDLTNIERKFIQQQNNNLNNENYTWILKLNVNNNYSFPNNGETDKVILPTDLLNVLSKDESIYPLYFNIKCINNNIDNKYDQNNNEYNYKEFGTHCGVLDYLENPGYISLPKKVIRCLNINENNNNNDVIWIQISYRSLLKGTYALFELINNEDLFNIHDIESLLQIYLRNYFNTLTINDTIVVNQLHNSLSKNSISIIKIKKLEPEEYISLINTDLQIDIIYNQDQINNNNYNFNDQNDYNIKQLNIGDLYYIKNEIERFKVHIPFELRKILTNEENRNTKLNIVVNSNENYDIYVSFPPLFEASSHLYSNRSFPEDNNNLIISYSDIKHYIGKFNNNSTELLFPSIIFITIQKCTLNCSNNNNINNNNNIQVKIVYNNIEQELNNEYKICNNCNRKILISNFEIHSLHCEKIYIKCHLCKVIIKNDEFKNHTHCEKCDNFGLNINEVEYHNKLYHINTKCKLCNQYVKPILLKIHQTEECPKRIILCRFCNNYVEASIEGHEVDFRDSYYYNLTSHESYCGSRTTKCIICNKIILIKQQESHLKLVHPNN